MTGAIKTVLTGLMLTVVCVLGGLSVSFAAQHQAVPQAKPSESDKLRKAPHLALPMCSVTASELQNGQKPIANGGTVAYGGGNPKNWVWVKVHGLPKPNTPYTVRILITNGSQTQHDISTQLSLPPGSSKSYGPYQVHLPGVTNKPRARVFITDGTSQGRRQPACQIAWTAQVAH